MNSNPANTYLRNKVLTASPMELRLMLYDGAIKFCRQALDAIEQGQIETSYDALVRAQKIMLELSTSLKHDADADLCSRLSSLYTYIYRLLVDANMQREAQPVEEAIRLLEFERETWLMLMEQLGAAPTEASQTRGPAAYPPTSEGESHCGAVGSLSLSG